MGLSNKSSLLLAELSHMPRAVGAVAEERLFTEKCLVVLMHDCSFINVDVQRATVKLIDCVVNTRFVNLVACDGAYGDVDTGWLRNIGDLTLRKAIVDNLFEEGS